MTAPGYVIVDARVVDPDKYSIYKELATKAMKAHGAEVLIRGGAAYATEGDWCPERIVLLRFPSMAAAYAYVGSVEYSAARQARVGAADMNMVVVEGVNL